MLLFSYTLYLTHVPVLKMLRELGRRNLQLLMLNQLDYTFALVGNCNGRSLYPIKSFLVGLKFVLLSQQQSTYYLKLILLYIS